jgi:copper(I)-binding protein
MSHVTTRRTALFFAGFLATTGSAFGAALAADEANAVSVDHAWARTSVASTGAAYVTLKGGAAPDALVSLATPAAASAELHQSATDNGVVKMRSVPSLPIPAGKAVTLAPGGYHVMLMGLKQPLVAGQSFPLTLTFAHAAPVTVDVQVQAVSHAAPAEDHDHMHMHQ